MTKPAVKRLSFIKWMDIGRERWAVFKHSKLGCYARNPKSKEVETAPTIAELIGEIIFLQSHYEN